MSDPIRTENRIWGLVAYALTPVGALLALGFWGYMLFCGSRAYRGQDVNLPLISGLLGQ